MREIEYLEELTSWYPVLGVMKGGVLAAYEIPRDYRVDGDKVMIAGNGGSYADSEHVVGKLMKGFTEHRPVSGEFAAAPKRADEKRGGELVSCLQGGSPTIVLTSHVGLSIASPNDVNGEMIYAQQLYGYGKEGDVSVSISTSDNAENVMYAMVVVKASGIRTIGLTDKNGGEMAGVYGCSIAVPSDETSKIRRPYLPVYRALCPILEEHFCEV